MWVDLVWKKLQRGRARDHLQPSGDLREQLVALQHHGDALRSIDATGDEPVAVTIDPPLETHGHDPKQRQVQQARGF